MSENLIESVAPLLAPPVTRVPPGLAQACPDDGADVAVLLFIAVAFEGDADE